MITDILQYNGTAFAPDYEVGFVTGSEPRLPEAEARTLERIGAWPVIVALQRRPQRLALLIRIVGSDTDSLRADLFRLFGPESEQPAPLVGQNHNGVEQSVDALCEGLRIYGDQRHDTVFVATLAVDGDVRWNATAATSDTWSITASGQTHTISNTGEDEAYPAFELTPTTAKGGDYLYKRYTLVTWRAINPAYNYPIRLGPLDTAALVTAGHMQADGDDLRVFVDGQEVARHLVGMNTTATYIWFSTSWQTAPELELTANIAGTGTVDSIELDNADEMAKLPSVGVVRIGSEAFAYTTVDLINCRLTDIERAVWGTAAAIHSAGDDVFWLQHEVELVYGDSAATAPDIAGTAPIFIIASSDNTEWRFEEFGQGAYPTRPAAWGAAGNITLAGRGGLYTATERALVEPYLVAGVWLTEKHGEAYGWFLYNACGIVNAEWSGGKKRAVVTDEFCVELRYWIRDDSWWSNQAVLTDPATADTWETWSEAAAVSDWDPADFLAIIAYFLRQDAEVSTVVVSLNANETPLASIGAEGGNYTVAAEITNETTGEKITVGFEMAVNETLTINTEGCTVVYEADNTNQFQAVSPDAVRRHWLRLLPGSNTLRFDDANTGDVTLETEFNRRYY